LVATTHRVSERAPFAPAHAMTASVRARPTPAACRRIHPETEQTGARRIVPVQTSHHEADQPASLSAMNAAASPPWADP
jgi:hypothetical protein